MSDTKNIGSRASKGSRSFGRYAVAALWLVLAVSCGDSAAVAPPGTGTGGSGGTGGSVGTGGSGGSGGMAGSAGTGGMAGTGGTGAAGGTSGSISICIIDGLPDKDLCDTDDDCEKKGPLFSGHLCVASGCETPGGSPIKQCVPSWAPSCSGAAPCPHDGTPDEGKYACVQVGLGSDHCVRVAEGCDVDTESYDCAPGFSCEGRTCVDRRLPCGSSFDCPKSHVCLTSQVAKYCVRAHRTCAVLGDCKWRGAVGEACADVDLDGRMECVGELNAEPFGPCVNSACGGSVCESAGVVATCGDYGLCLTNDDCGTGFECAPLWQDGRRECVPTGGTCDQVTDCPLPLVCAAPRNGENGGRPSCQAGTGP